MKTIKHRGLEWSDFSDEEMDWEKAKKYAELLGFRLPTRDEIETLSEDEFYPDKERLEELGFRSKSFIWTSEEIDEEDVKIVNFIFSDDGVDDKTNRNHVILVREIGSENNNYVGKDTFNNVGAGINDCIGFYDVEEDLIDKNIEVNGREYLENLVVEECAELIDAMMKYKRGRLSINTVIEEMADVKMTIDNIKQIHNKEEFFKNCVEYKQKRLKEVLK